VNRIAQIILLNSILIDEMHLINFWGEAVPIRIIFFYCKQGEDSLFNFCAIEHTASGQHNIFLDFFSLLKFVILIMYWK